MQGMILPPSPLPEGVLTGLALVLAAGYALGRARSDGLDADAMSSAILAATLGALLGGHGLFTATHGGGSTEWLRFWGDQSVFGVLLGGSLAAAAYLRARRLPVLPFADAAAPGVALGYALARVGCALNADDFGRVAEVRWAVRYPAGTAPWNEHLARGLLEASAPASLPVHPVQFYLALVGVATFLLLHLRRFRRGTPVAIACLAYGVGRFALEPLRDDFVAVMGPLSLPQWFALVLAATGAAVLLAARRWRTGPLRVAWAGGADRRAGAPAVPLHAAPHLREVP
jgi:phosphatidylglycerol---prolipoprotein diacylglyceryl transferase